MAKPFTINGADPAAAVQTILKAAKEDGWGVTVRHDHKTGNLTIEDSYGANKRAVVVENGHPGTWRGIFEEIRRLAKMKVSPSGRATFQQGTITNDSPKRGEVMGAPLFKVKMNRLIKVEFPSRINVTVAED